MKRGNAMSAGDDPYQTLAAKAFGVENAFNLYALDYVHMPAWAIYEKEMIAEIQDTIDLCHIYLIGQTPKISLTSAHQEDTTLVVSLEYLGKAHQLFYPLDDGMEVCNEDGYYFVRDAIGQRFFPSTEEISKRLSMETSEIFFQVQYIGQSLGKDGKRNAHDRLLKHETLQKISLQGAKDGYHLVLLMLGIADNRVMTVFNPFAKNIDDDDERIAAGLDKLYDTTLHERVTLFEASLIRYFKPHFNIEFKNSFPSTNMKVLQDCYDKDFTAITAEIIIDELPFQLCSDAVAPAHTHTAFHHLHDDESRKAFFYL
ncbi:hypothetical protein KFF05_05865 [bacterium SCSIO 12827]|nr:hypothetical protein KFF05_05865 [bacterium SCSIO 12827]